MTDPISEPFQWPPSVELRRDPASIARHREALRAVVQSRPDPVAGYGRGIVYVGGGRYWPGIVVGVRVLRELGCGLPVEVWFRGDHESVNAGDVARLGVTLQDLDAMSRDLGDNRVISPNEYAGGWEAKLYALTHTRLAEVLYLDADAYCVADPVSLFEQLDPPLNGDSFPGGQTVHSPSQ